MPIPLITQLHTPRLTVRPVQRDDLTDLLEVNREPEVTKFLPYATWQSLADAEAWFARMEKVHGGGTGQQLVIVRNEDNKTIGTLVLFKFEEGSARLEVGYVLGRAYWRQGYASEALRAVIDHAFGEMGIRRIEAEVNPANEASNALIRSLGFVHEGLLRKRWVNKGVACDMNFYGCLVEEWRCL